MGQARGSLGALIRLVKALRSETLDDLVHHRFDR
jgi:uncharacterized protein (DUF3820 family)